MRIYRCDWKKCIIGSALDIVGATAHDNWYSRVTLIGRKTTSLAVEHFDFSPLMCLIMHAIARGWSRPRLYWPLRFDQRSLNWVNLLMRLCAFDTTVHCCKLTPSLLRLQHAKQLRSASSATKSIPFLDHCERLIRVTCYLLSLQLLICKLLSYGEP